MDISIDIFIDAEEFIQFLRFVSDGGGSILYKKSHRVSYKRIEPGDELADDLLKTLRSPLKSTTPHLLYVGVKDTASHPDKINPQRLICAYFGGFDKTALYLSSISARSDNKVTLAFMRKAKRWLIKRSQTGVEVVSEMISKRYLVRDIHYTEGARLLPLSGYVLRQRSVINSYFEISSKVVSPKSKSSE